MANATRAPPISVDVEVYRHPTWKSGSAMWQQDKQWIAHRTVCMARIDQHYRSHGGVPQSTINMELAGNVSTKVSTLDYDASLSRFQELVRSHKFTMWLFWRGLW